MQGKALQDFVIDKIDDLKGQDIIALDVQGKSSITDCMIICTGTSSRHVMSIADHVVQESRAAGLLPLGVEGENSADWIVVDLGYSRWQCLNWLLLPSVASALAMAMLAIVAWSLSVVDVAIILGPGNPPTLAVISWQWLTQGDADQQTKGALASLLLMLLLAAYDLLGYLLWRGWRRTIPRVDGVRKPATPLLPSNTLASV